MKEWLVDWGPPIGVGIVLVVMFATGRPVAPRLEGDAPDFTIATLDGGTVSKADLAGERAVLNFWATWCAPCKQEVPEFAAFAEAHPEIPVLGVVVDTGDTSKVERLRKSWGMSYDIAIANDAMLSAYDIDALPTTVLLDANGSVLKAHVGMMTRGNLEDALGL